MHIGLIGGIGPAATAMYYSHIVSVFTAAKRPLQLTIGHTNAQDLSRNSSGGFAVEQAAEYKRIAEQLAAAGADFVAITSMGGHFCSEQFAEISPLSLIDGPQAVVAFLKTQGDQRIGLLGAGTVMRSILFGTLAELDVVVPQGPALEQVNEDYIASAIAGCASAEQAERLLAAGVELVANQGAQAILLGGTDLSLVYSGANLDFPVFDSALIHADAIAKAAMEG